MKTDYRRAFEKALGAALRSPQRRSLPAIHRYGESLLKHPPPRRRILIQNSPQYSVPELCEWLVARSDGLRFDDPGAMIAAAEAAIEVSESLDEAVETEVIANDLRAESWAARGNALRILGDFPQATACFSRAIEYLVSGSGDPLLAARISCWRGAYSVDHRQFHAALKLYLAAFRTYITLDEFHLAGRALVMIAIALTYDDRPQDAMECLVLSLGLVEVELEPALVISAVHSMAYLLAQADQAGDARRLIRASYPLYSAVPGRLAALRLTWMEGRVLASAGLHSEAEVCLSRVREGFHRKRMAYDAALAGLDLAGVYLQTRQLARVTALAQEMHATFSVQGLGEQATAALLLLVHAAREQRLTQEALAQTAACIQQARRERLQRS